MRTHERYVSEDVRPEAITENPAPVPLAAVPPTTGTAPPAPAPNVRVAPAGGRKQKAAADPGAAPRSRAHLWYVGLEGVKVILLIALGAALLAG